MPKLNKKSLTGDPELDALIGDEDPKVVFRRLKVSEAKRLDGRKFSFYEPNGKCEEFISAVGSGENFVTYFSAANGVGKTAASANIVAHIVFPGLSDNEYFDLPLFNDWQYPKRGRIVTDPNNVTNVIAALREWFPKGKYTTNKGGKSFERYWSTPDGWKIEIMTYEQDPKEFEGPTLGWVWFDEPPPRSIYKACVSRLRLGGIIFISATPLIGSAWLFDELVNGKTEVEGLDGKEKIVRKVAHIEADVEAACIEHGVRGHLQHGDIMRMVAEYSADEREARAKGKHAHLAGRVLKAFDRKIHVIPPFEVDRRRFVVLHAFDPHPRTNDAVTWVAVDRQGRKYVVDELWIKCANGTEELAQNIKAKDSHYRMIRRLMDPSGFNENQHDDAREKSVADKMALYGLHYVPATKTRALSNKRIEDALGFTMVPGSAEFLKAPELYIFSTCVRTIYEIENWRWDEYSAKTEERRGPKERPVDKDDHMIENLGRILVQEPVFVEMERTGPSSYSARTSAGNGGDPYD